MEKEGTTFIIDKELDLTKTPSSDVKAKVSEELKNVQQGHYMLIDISSYSYIAEIAKAVIMKGATVDNVLKKNNNRWTIMLKNSVPVAQTG